MLRNTAMSLRAAMLSTALALPGAALAQQTFTYTDWDTDGNLELTQSEFTAGFEEAEVFDAWDRDDTVGLTREEFGAGLYSAWDTDDDLQITEAEYDVGTERWYGADYDTPFTEWDADASGYIDTTEFREAWDTPEYGYATWDTDADELVTETEFTTGVYDRVDLDDDMVVTIEEEGWFEGWFDGDDIEAEVQEVGEVY